MGCGSVLGPPPRDGRNRPRQLPTQLDHVLGNPSRHAITVASTVRLEMYQHTGLSMCPGRDLRSTSACIGQREPDSVCGQLWNRLGHALLLIPTPIPSMREVEALVQRVESQVKMESPSCSILLLPTERGLQGCCGTSHGNMLRSGLRDCLAREVQSSRRRCDHQRRSVR